MRAGDLNQRIEFEERVEITDQVGDPIPVLAFLAYGLGSGGTRRRQRRCARAANPCGVHYTVSDSLYLWCSS